MKYRKHIQIYTGRKNYLETINLMKVNTSGPLVIEISNVKDLFNLVFKASFDSFK